MINEQEKNLEFLERKGFDIGQALMTCADDIGIYMEVLETAWEEGRKKLPIIEESIEIGDFERYHIEVHALKNAMRAIGAMELSELAIMQEKAAKSLQYESIERGCQVLLTKYREVLHILAEIFET